MSTHTQLLRTRPAKDLYAASRHPYGFDGQVGGRVRSLVHQHDGRDGTVQPPRRDEPRRVMVLLDGDAEFVAIEPTLVRALHVPHLARMDELGLEAICYRAETVPIAGGEGRFESLPKDMIARDGRGVIIWREPDRMYGTAGWEPWRAHLGGMFGGRLTTIHGALGWYQRALDIEAGRASDFSGAGATAERERDQAALNTDEQRDQASRCSCRGSDDLCPCQNVPDQGTQRTRAAEAIPSEVLP